MDRYIDVEPMRDDWLNEVNESIFCPNDVLDSIDSQPDADAEPKRKWIPCSVRLPECEQEVWIQTKRGIRTTAMYEDGKMPEDESEWNWNDIDFDYDEKTDTYFIPEGWWEYRHFNPDDVYNCLVDEEVVAWMPLPDKYEPESVKK